MWNVLVYRSIDHHCTGQGAVSVAFAVGAIGEPATEGCEDVVLDAFFRGADIILEQK